jgi:hypothetical protein
MTAAVAPPATCQHVPPCPPADATDHDAARIVASHPEQGWWLRCNGVITFDDTGELVPDAGPSGCYAVAPHRPDPPHHTEGGLPCPPRSMSR